jgi:AcrR family transcriptional regulator
MGPTKTAPRLTRAEQRERTRARLIEAARRLFIAQGFHGTSVEQIAEAAGYTRGAFYSNFEDKDDIFIALLDDDQTKRIAELNVIFGESRSLEDAFASIIRGNEARDIRPTTILHTEFWLYAMRNPKVRRRLAEIQRNERKAYERAIKAQFDALGLDVPFDLHDAALVMIALDTGGPRLGMLDPEDVGPNFFFRATLQLFEATQALARQRAAAKNK